MSIYELRSSGIKTWLNQQVTISWTNITGTTSSVLKLQKLGNVITAQISSCIGTMSAAKLVSNAGVIPVGYRPISETVYLPVVIQNNSALVNGTLAISNAGTITVSTASDGNYTAAAGGIYRNCFSYTIN